MIPVGLSLRIEIAVWGIEEGYLCFWLIGIRQFRGSFLPQKLINRSIYLLKTVGYLRSFLFLIGCKLVYGGMRQYDNYRA